MRNILFFGDSLTAGYGLRNAGRDSFPALIAQKIGLLKLNYNIINAGLSGDTSAGGLRRIDYWLSQPVSIFVLELGINDIIRGIAPQITLANLQAIIDKVMARYPNARIAVMGMQIPDFIPALQGRQFNDLFGVLATKNSAAFYPFFLNGVAGKSNLNLPDRLHPSAEGYKVIANNIWPVIEPLL